MGQLTSRLATLKYVFIAVCCFAMINIGVFITYGLGNKDITNTILSDLSVNNQLKVDELKSSLDKLKVKFDNQQSKFQKLKSEKLKQFIHQEYINHEDEICDPEQEMGRFVDAGGSSATQCPDTTLWINKFAVLDPSPEKTIIIVGCNKGLDAVQLFSQYDNSLKPFKSDSWVNALKQFDHLHAVCGYKKVLDRGSSDTRNLNKTYAITSPTVYCIEPMSANIHLLKQLQNLTGINSVYFKVLQYAIGDPTNETVVHFPTAQMGKETLRISNNGSYSVVKYTSLDLLFKNIEKIDILSIDTEGNDPAVLYGAAETLKKTRYMEFEVHRDLKDTAWRTVTLQSAIQYVDDLGFECFWINSKGLLFQITNCWHSEFEKQSFRWSNIGCVNRQDQWYAVLKELHKKQTFKSKILEWISNAQKQ